MECLVLTVAISQTWDLMISWSDNYLLLIFDVLVKKTELKLDIKFDDIFRWGNYSRGDSIQGGHYRLEKGFDRGHYSRGYII